MAPPEVAAVQLMKLLLYMDADWRRPEKFKNNAPPLPDNAPQFVKAQPVKIRVLLVCSTYIAPPEFSAVLLVKLLAVMLIVAAPIIERQPPPGEVVKPPGCPSPWLFRKLEESILTAMTPCTNIPPPWLSWHKRRCTVSTAAPLKDSAPAISCVMP